MIQHPERPEHSTIPPRTLDNHAGVLQISDPFMHPPNSKPMKPVKPLGHGAGYQNPSYRGEALLGAARAAAAEAPTVATEGR